MAIFRFSAQISSLPLMYSGPLSPLPLHVAQMQQTQPEAPSLAGIGQLHQQIGDLFVFGL
jgi:hypothetical protein